MMSAQYRRAYELVHKLLDEGWQKTAAVRQAADDLGCKERSVWYWLRVYEEERKRELENREQMAREYRLALGLEEYTEQELEEAGEAWISFMIDFQRRK